MPCWIKRLVQTVQRWSPHLVTLQPNTACGDESLQLLLNGTHMPTIRVNMLNQTCRQRFLSQALSSSNCEHLLKQLSYSPHDMCSCLITGESLFSKFIFWLSNFKKNFRGGNPWHLTNSGEHNISWEARNSPFRGIRMLIPTQTGP